MLSMDMFGYILTCLGAIPVTSLVVMQIKSRRLSKTATIASILSIVLFIPLFILPWAKDQSSTLYLYDMWKIMDLLGDVFFKLLILSTAFAVFGASLWLAEISGGKEILALASAAGFTITIGIILSLALIGSRYVNTRIDDIAIGAWITLILYCINIATTIIKGKRLKPFNMDNRISIENIINEAKKVVQNRAETNNKNNIT